MSSSTKGDESVTTTEKQLPTFLDVAFLQRVLEENLTDEGPVRVDDFTASPATKPGDNYSSDVFTIVVRYNDTKEIRLVVKIVVNEETIKSFGENINAFGKEVNTFHKLLPVFSKIVSGTGADGSVVLFGARCFYATRDPLDTLVFEDLKALGYRMPDRTCGGLDFAHCELIMRKIGRFHAASMVYVARGATERKLVADYYSHGIILPGDDERTNPALMMFGAGIAKFLEVSADWPELDPAIRQKLEALKPNYVRRVAQSLSAEDASEALCYRVLNHGDLWSNNMMFLYDDASDEATVREVMFVDYQCSSYASPGIDLVYCLHNCPRFEVRENRIEELLQIYHRSLREGLRAGDYQLSVPTFADVQTEYARHEFIGLVSGLSMLPIILMERTDEVKLTFDNLINAEHADKIRTIQYQGRQYRKSVISILERFYAKGLLD